MSGADRPSPRPPRLAAWLLARALPPGASREGLMGDLEEEYGQRARTGGLVGAWASYWTASITITLRFGLERVRRRGGTLAGRSQDSSGALSFLPSVLADVRYSLRVLMRNPGFAAAAVITMALGIGANTAVFAVVNGVLFRPLPFDDPDAIVAVGGSRFYGGREVEFFADNARTLEAVASLSPGWGYALGGGSQPTQVVAGRTSAGIFDLLGVRPELGRTFFAHEDTPGNEAVVILGHALWSQQFGRDPEVIGRSITLSGAPHEVVGVMPAGFNIRGTQQHDLWIPLPMDPSFWYYSGGALQVIGRLADGFTIEQGNLEARALVPTMRTEFGEDDTYASDFELVSLAEITVGDNRTTFLLLLGAAAFILLIAGANLGGLLMARTTGRTEEVTVRLSLGASRRRLVRQLVTESAVLSAVGGGVGLAVAFAGVPAIVSMLPPSTPRLHEISVDRTVLIACLAASALTGLVFGLSPALAATRTALHRGLRAATAGAGAGRAVLRTRNAMVVVQVALAMVLLVGAGLMMRTLGNLGSVDPGFRTEGVLTMKLQIPGSTGATEIYRDVREGVSALPGVTSVGTTHHFPIKESSWTARVEVEGRPMLEGTSLPTTTWRSVDPGFFEALSIPLIAGRTLTDRDGLDSEQVVVVNQALAAALFGDEPAVGQRIQPLLGEPDEMSTIVGVVADVRTVSLRREGGPVLYRPAAQRPLAARTLVVRTAVDPATLVGAIRSTVWEVNADIPISDIATVDQVLYESIARPRVVTLLLGSFAAVGTLLGMVGIYGVIAYTVGRRTRELGLRIALGAPTSSVQGLVLRQSLTLALIGVGIGVGGTLLLGRFLSGLVFGVPTTDPSTLVGLAAGLIAVAVLAGWVPARRAARISPMNALREQ